MPWTMEGAAMQERDAPVRECSLCAGRANSACAHLGDYCVRLWASPNSAEVCWGTMDEHDNWGVGPVCDGAVYPTEAEGRAEFERRVALMLGREVA